MCQFTEDDNKNIMILIVIHCYWYALWYYQLTTKYRNTYIIVWNRYHKVKETILQLDTSNYANGFYLISTYHVNSNQSMFADEH